MVFTQNAVDGIFDNKVKNYRDKFNGHFTGKNIVALVVSGNNKKGIGK